MITPEEFIKQKTKQLEEEFLFLSFCYEDFKSKNSSLPIDEINKKFHEAMIENLKDESFNEDTYRIFIKYLDLDVKLPSLLDRKIENVLEVLKEDDEEELSEADIKILYDFIKTLLKDKPKPKTKPSRTYEPSPCSYSGARYGGC